MTDAEWGPPAVSQPDEGDARVEALRQRLLETFYDYHSVIGEQVRLMDALIRAARQAGPEGRAGDDAEG